MEKLEDFRQLNVWKKAHKLVLDIYKLTAKLPSEEKFGLTSQMRRAAVSVPANIAEGFKKRGKPDKARFYNIAQGSLEELRYYLILSKDLQLITNNTELWDMTEEIGRMLTGLMASCRN